jgi:hypothetical protein
MDRPSLGEREPLVAPRLEPQKGTHLVEHTTAMCRRGKGETPMANASKPAEELRNAPDEKTVWGIIHHVLTEIARLEITTVVKGDGGANQTLYTCINLLQADRTNEIDKSFLTDSAVTPLRDFHSEQVKLAVQDLQQRIDFVQKLAAAVIDVMRKT